MNSQPPLASASAQRIPLRIVQVLAPARFGGLERVVQALAGGLVQRGHEVHVVAVLDRSDTTHPFLDSLVGSGVRMVPLRLAGRAYFRERAAVRQLCRRVQPHVVHTHGYRPDVVDGAVARRLGIPTVTTVHGNTGGDWKNRLYEGLQRHAFRKMDAVVAVSRPQVSGLRSAGVKDDRLHVVPNAWPGDGNALEASVARRTLGLAEGRFHVGWVGRLTAEKGPDIWIEALGLLTDLPLTASILGDGALRPALEQRVADLGLNAQVIFHGTVPEAGRYLRAFDLFVMSSRTEGTPMALFEAMAAKVPIVAARVGGVPDVVTSEGGVLVDLEDPRALADGVRAVYVGRAAAERRAEAAYERLSTEYALEPWVVEYESIYRHLANPESSWT